MCNYQLHVLGCHPIHSASVPMDQCLCLSLVVCRNNIQDHRRVPPPSVSSFKLTFVVPPLMTADPKTCVLKWSVVRSNQHGQSCSDLNVTPSLHNARCGEILTSLPKFKVKVITVEAFENVHLASISSDKIPNLKCYIPGITGGCA